MGFFTNRERDALGKLPQTGGGTREFAQPRRDVQEGRSPVERDLLLANRERHAPAMPPRPSDRPREFDRAKQDVPPPREPRQADPGSLFQHAWDLRVREIDMLIADLQRMRETLNSEASRVQRVVVAYATFSEAAAQSSKVICESLRSSLGPLRDKRQHEKRSSRARRKAARRLARQMRQGKTGPEAATREPEARPA